MCFFFLSKQTECRVNKTFDRINLEQRRKKVKRYEAKTSHEERKLAEIGSKNS